MAGRVVRIGRSEVEVRIGAPPSRSIASCRCAVTLALGMPANERMDALVEKATELGVAAIQPLVCERSVLRLAGERAEARQRALAGGRRVGERACGRARVPRVGRADALDAWLRDARPRGRRRARWCSASADRRAAGDAARPARDVRPRPARR